MTERYMLLDWFQRVSVLDIKPIVEDMLDGPQREAGLKASRGRHDTRSCVLDWLQRVSVSEFRAVIGDGQKNQRKT